MDGKTLRACVVDAVGNYIKDLDGAVPEGGIYDLVIREMEVAMYSAVYFNCGLNQSLATKSLGVSRATFRYKAELYELIIPKKHKK